MSSGSGVKGWFEIRVCEVARAHQGAEGRKRDKLLLGMGMCAWLMSSEGLCLECVQEEVSSVLWCADTNLKFEFSKFVHTREHMHTKEGCV
jgi:hypothetical protein